MDNHSIWHPLVFDDHWNDVNTEKFDNIYPSWERRRKELQKMRNNMNGSWNN
ncbi:MAG: hypothetical protein K2I07_12310 [Lachnospiraceae bacterium]|nr:hypothetical protein [Lachnospiraceae bacterium]